MSTGRPKASSRETLSEAACELFLERGYAHTSVGDIARRAGVSRSSFFNYFDSKSDVLWASLDERIARLESSLLEGAPLRAALEQVTAEFAPDSLALALTHASVMGIAEELERESAWRRARIAASVAARVRSTGVPSLDADIVGSAHGGAIVGAIVEWARRGPGTTELSAVASAALDRAELTIDGDVRQLRLVATTDDFDGAVAFYRDVVGMREGDAFQGEHGARVAILHAGRATLELANPAQVDLIDRVETDGDAPSEPLRIGLEVADTDATVAAMTAAGARVEATPRVTPWRSLNARLRAPAGLQVTVFQELGAESTVPGEPDAGS